MKDENTNICPHTILIPSPTSLSVAQDSVFSLRRGRPLPSGGLPWPHCSVGNLRLPPRWHHRMDLLHWLAVFFGFQNKNVHNQSKRRCRSRCRRVTVNLIKAVFWSNGTTGLCNGNIFIPGDVVVKLPRWSWRPKMKSLLFKPTSDPDWFLSPRFHFLLKFWIFMQNPPQNPWKSRSPLDLIQRLSQQENSKKDHKVPVRILSSRPQTSVGGVNGSLLGSHRRCNGEGGRQGSYGGRYSVLIFISNWSKPLIFLLINLSIWRCIFFTHRRSLLIMCWFFLSNLKCPLFTSVVVGSLHRMLLILHSSTLFALPN